MAIALRACARLELFPEKLHSHPKVRELTSRSESIQLPIDGPAPVERPALLVRGLDSYDLGAHVVQPHWHQRPSPTLSFN